MNRLFDRRSVDASNVVGNFVGGDVTGTLVQNFFSGGTAPQEPSLVWQDLPDDPNEVFRTLSWHVRLTTLYGRKCETKKLQDWIGRAESPRVRIVSGPGGSGKTRLAAELADRLRAQGWTAGFWRLDKAAVFPVRAQGLLLVLDYPEQHPDGVRALLSDLASLESTPAPIRVLMLSRQPFAWWTDDIDAAGAGHLLDTQEFELERLTEADAFALYAEAEAVLARRYSKPWVGPRQTAFDVWVHQDPSMHLLPLFVRAAALHSVLDPAETLRLSGERINAALVRRERQRLRGVSEAAGLGKEGLPRLVGLAAAGGGLDAAALQRLADPGLQLGLPVPERVVDMVREVSWWSDQELPAPAPDLLAAEQLAQVLGQRPDLAGEWLWAAMEGGGADLTDRLGRLLDDLGRLSATRQKILYEALLRMIRVHPERAATLTFLTWAPRLPVSLAPFTVELCRAGLAATTEDVKRAYWLDNLSSRLAEVGDRAGALQSIRDAVTIERRLAKQDPARLAVSLHNLAHRLAEAGDWAGALQPIRDAVAIQRRLAKRNPVRFEPDLAANLLNLSGRLSEVGDRAGALQPIRESVAIRRQLAKQDPARFEPGLAESLHALATCLSEVGDRAEALEMIRDAVVIWRRQNPERFEPDLAGSLFILSTLNKDAAEALEKLREAVAIQRRLAKRNPARFEPDLALSLGALALRLSEVGHRAEALETVRDDVAIWRRLAKQDPARFEPELATGLGALSMGLAEAGDRAEALETARDAVAIQRRLAEKIPARFELHLVAGLCLLSMRLEEAGDIAEAIRVAEESVRLIDQSQAPRIPFNALRQKLHAVAERLRQQARTPSTTD